MLANLEKALAADIQKVRMLIAELYGKIDILAEDKDICGQYNNAASSFC